MTIKIPQGKTDTERDQKVFMILPEKNGTCCMFDIIQEYFKALPETMKKGKFFKSARKEFINSNVGINKIKTVGIEIAKALELENPEQYTGHCFRRSGATHFANQGASTKMLKRKGRWHSDSMQKLL